MRLRTWLTGLLWMGVGACTSPVGPLGPDLPEEVTFAGLTFRASAEVVDDGSSVQVTALVSNETAEIQSAEINAGETQVLVLLYRGSETPVFDQADTFGGFGGGALELTLSPGESLVLPRSPVIDARDVLGSEFERGRYLVAASMAPWTYVNAGDRLTLVKGVFELRAGVIDLR